MKTSVALCTYNGAKYLQEQIDSILNQSLPVDEIVVCDDRSTDDTILILEKYKHKHPDLFRIYINDTTLKSVKNFEKALLLCSHEILFLSDQDDLWEPNKVADYIAYFKKHPHINVIASNGYHLDPQSNKSERISCWDIPQTLKNKNITFDYFQLIAYVGNIATGASMGIKKSFIEKIVPIPIVSKYHHDEWIAILAAAENSFVLLDKKYFSYRIHEAQQVGGVFWEHKRDLTELIINTCDINSKKLPIWGYKNLLKRVIESYRKNKKIATANTQFTPLFKQNVIATEKLYYKIKNDMRKNYFFTASVLHITDRIKNKRQLNKRS